MSISSVVATLARAALFLNKYDIRERARHGDKAAKLFYPMCFSSNKLTATLLLLKTASHIAMTTFLILQLGVAIGVIISGVAIVVTGEVVPLIYLRQYGLPLNKQLAVLLQKISTTLTPISKPLVWVLDHWYGQTTPIVHSKDELFAIFNETELTGDTTIIAQEVEIIRSALTFGDRTVREVMTPLRAVKVVYESDQVGPLLMDDLYNSGFSRFPVLAGKSDKRLTGTLFIRDLVARKHKGTVQDVMSSDLFYVHEEQPLAHALQAFIKTKHHMFVVVNSFEEYVGIITIEDIVEQVIGKQIVDEFDKYDSVREVAKLHAEREHKQRSRKEVGQAVETDTKEVV
jgi:metal transporter CNNM